MARRGAFASRSMTTKPGRWVSKPNKVEQGMVPVGSPPATTNELSQGYPGTASTSNSAGGTTGVITRLTSLIDKLEVHLADDTLIKGWEVDKRVLKNGKQRGPLRAVARDIRLKSVKANAKRAETEEQRLQIAAAANSSATNLLPAELAYLSCIEKLYHELWLGYEQDFDAHLRDGLEWSQAVRARISPELAPATLSQSSTPAVLADVFELDGQKLLAELHAQRGAGHRGRAIDRDLKEATRCHGEAQALWRKMQEYPSTCEGTDLPTLHNVQVEYLAWVRKLLVELQREGEPDFDGMLRNCINFLANEGKKTCY